jgi:hypothetical protein
MRTWLLTLATLVVAAPLAAQTPAKPADPDQVVAPAPLPAGWSARLDRANASPAAVKFVAMGDGFHATMGPAAIFYNPSIAAKGTYSATGTFSQTKAPAHPEAYGLLIGGENLGADNQSYLYYVVRQDGMYAIKHRAGADVHTLVDWTAHSAIRKADESGKATNALRIDVGDKTMSFFANGELVKSMERATNTDGLVGLRVNHNLDVHISNFGVTVPVTK